MSGEFIFCLIVSIGAMVILGWLIEKMEKGR